MMVFLLFISTTTLLLANWMSNDNTAVNRQYKDMYLKRPHTINVSSPIAGSSNCTSFCSFPLCILCFCSCCYFFNHVYKFYKLYKFYKFTSLQVYSTTLRHKLCNM